MAAIATTSSIFLSPTFQVCSCSLVFYLISRLLLAELRAFFVALIRTLVSLILFEISVDGVTMPPEEEKESYAWLQERDNPEDLAVVSSTYRGPKIVLN